MEEEARPHPITPTGVWGLCLHGSRDRSLTSRPRQTAPLDGEVVAARPERAALQTVRQIPDGGELPIPALQGEDCPLLVDPKLPVCGTHPVLLRTKVSVNAHTHTTFQSHSSLQEFGTQQILKHVSQPPPVPHLELGEHSQDNTVIVQDAPADQEHALLQALLPQLLQSKFLPAGNTGRFDQCSCVCMCEHKNTAINQTS